MSLENDLATLGLNVDPDEGKPLYVQLADALRSLIRKGRLHPGDRLPSSRKLALLLNISRTSTLNAYDQLAAEGLLVSRSTSGIFVTGMGNRPGKNRVTPVTQQPAAQPPETFSIRAFDAGPDVHHFPFADWSRSLARVWRHPNPSLLKDFHPGGYWALRQAVSHYIKAARGVACSPEQIIITAGNRDAMNLIAATLLQPGDSVALENPCYPPQRHVLATQGANIHNCAVDSEGMQLPKSPVALAWMTPARQYPLGITQSTARRLEWLAYSRQEACWLVEDDYDGEFHYRKSPLLPLFQMANQLQSDQHHRVIFVGSFSKLMFRTLRIGYLIVPQSLIDGFLDTQARLGTLASVPVQPALADFIAHRRFASHLRRMRRLYQQRRDTLHELIGNHCLGLLESQLPDSGMHLLARPVGGLENSDTSIEQKLKAEGIYAPALSRHYAGKGEQGFVLGFSASDEAILAQAVLRLAHSCGKKQPSNHQAG